ncbi:hypothetical protein NX722_02340 [Endozoicomonas gorgoniicola]|uniref:Uncharacterized protein n=1 Tax=Endozoicomonas gorgoniicola TaxID=1234144 RepID=A0ABT3MQ48_9GAMM|nr:hypothetical protein [Endozoicomonas gorgoniicola]MCW7551499.1 hypothetical protein [Endozoicomonas gorgoniicola]
MKTVCKRFTLLSCLLFVCSIAHSGTPSKDQFNFLKHYDDSSGVESSLAMLTGVHRQISSTSINAFFWYGICKAPEFVSTFANRFKLGNEDQKELAGIKTNFCAQLAPVIATAEATLAGAVSPWPLEQVPWQALRFAGAGMIVFRNYGKESNLRIASMILLYFTFEATFRSVAGAVSTNMLRSLGTIPEVAMRNDCTDCLDYTSSYALVQNTLLLVISALIVGDITYQTMIGIGYTPAKATFAYAISTLSAGLMPVISIPTLNLNLDNNFIFRLTEIALISAIISRTVGGKALIEASTTAITTASATALTTAEFFANANLAGKLGFLAGSTGAFAGALTLAGSNCEAATIFITSLLAGLIIAAPLQPDNPTSYNFAENTATAVYSALLITLTNSLSNYFVYGIPLEEHLSETVRNQCKKFYAPLDYLSTMFDR